MSDFEKCSCGERAASYCRGCRTRRCRFCMVEQYFCATCRSGKRAKRLKELHTKTLTQARNARSLLEHWKDFRNDTLHDQIYGGAADRAVDLLKDAVMALESISGFDDNKSTTTDELDREKEERATRGTPYAT